MTTVAEAPGAATHEAAPAAVLHVTQGSYTGMTGTKLENDTSGVRTVDVYDLPALDLSSVRGLVINGNTDQVFLARHAGLLTDLVARGGRVAVMGHPVTDFLPGLGRWHRLDYTGPDDLEITPGDPHRCGRASTAPTCRSGAASPVSTHADTATGCPRLRA